MEQPVVPPHANVIAPPPLIFLGSILTAILLEFALPIGPIRAGGLSTFLGYLLIFAALALFIACVVQFRRHKEHPSTRRPTDAIISHGPYAISRNPIYLAFSVFQAGLGLVLGNTWMLILLVPTLAIIQRGVIYREEEYLTAKHGGAYESYKNSVRRWL